MRETNHKKIGTLSLLLVVWILACINTGGLTPDTSERVRMLSIVFNESQRKLFFDQLQTFANSHDFDFQSQIQDTNNVPSAATLTTEDDKIFVLVEELTLNYDVSPLPTMIYFIGGDSENPTDEETRMKIDEQVGDLIALLSDIPNIKITDVSCKDKADKDWERCLETVFPKK